MKSLHSFAVRHWPRAQPLGQAPSVEAYVHMPVPGSHVPLAEKVRREPPTQVGAGGRLHTTLIDWQRSTPLQRAASQPLAQAVSVLT